MDLAFGQIVLVPAMWGLFTDFLKNVISNIQLAVDQTGNLFYWIITQLS